jgi:integrase
MKPDRPIEAVEGSIPTTGIIKVDANMMTIDEYKVALAWLSGPYGFSGRYMRSASRVVLILGYRCGLRRSEAAYLRLSDFDDGDYLHVRPWFMRRLKTANALRDLPLRVLMPDDELQEVLAFIATARARGRNCSEGALLFAKEENSRVLINFERVIGQVHCAIRTIDPSLHYHSLRHSYCNILLLKLWPSLHPVARLVFRHHPAMIASFGDSELFRQQLFGTTAIKGADLQGIALLMGHGSALVSLGHYIHVLDWYGFRNGS